MKSKLIILFKNIKLHFNKYMKNIVKENLSTHIENKLTNYNKFFNKVRVNYINKENLRKVIFIISIFTMVFSTFQLSRIFIDYFLSAREYDGIRQAFYRPENIDIYEADSETISVSVYGLSSIYDEYVNISDIVYGADISFQIDKLNFPELLKLNSDTVGWIRIEDTKIDYPIVQGKDNEYYMDYSFTHEKRRGGCIFMDYRNNSRILGRNTILYGHHMKDGSMFQNMMLFKKKDFFDNHSKVLFSTLYEKHIWEIFAIYVTSVDFDYLVTEFESDESYEQFLKILKQKSIYQKDIELTKEDKILTLSTCSYEFDNARTVIHAKLIQ